MGHRIGHAPRYELRVNGTLLRADLGRLVESVCVEMDVDRADSVNVQVAALADPKAWHVLDAYAFAEGNRLEVSGGYETGRLTSLGRFDLQMPPVSGGRGGRRMEVIGLGGAHRMLDNRLARVYGADFPDSVIVTMLAQEYGFVPRVSPTLPRQSARVKEAGVSDFAFLNFLAAEARNARQEAFYWRVEWDESLQADVLTFAPISLAVPSARLRFRAEAYRDHPATMLAWDIEPTLKGVPTKIVVVYVDRATREEREVVAEVSDPTGDPEVLWSGRRGGLESIEEEIRDGSAVRYRANGDVAWGSAGAMFSSEAEAVDWARSVFRRHQLQFAEADFEVYGVETLRPWQVHDFVGMSKRWDGAYLLTSVTHTFSASSDPGYGCRLHAKRVPGANSLPRVSVTA